MRNWYQCGLRHHQRIGAWLYDRQPNCECERHGNLAPADNRVHGTGTTERHADPFGKCSAGGLTVNVSSSNTAVATVAPTATFSPGMNTAIVTVTALSVGSTVLHASGVNIPDATATATVDVSTLGRFTITGANVGKDLQAQLLITLDNPVPPGFPLQVTVSSSDGSKLVLGSLVGAGTQSTILGFPVGSNSGVLYAQALSDTGSVTVTVSATGYTSGSSTVTLTPSGFVMVGPSGVVSTVPQSFPTNVGSTTTLTVMTARLNSSFVYQESQGLRGGFSVTVPLQSSSGSVGSLNPGSRTFTPGDTAYSTIFTALAIGNTTLSAVAPATFNTPANGAGGITANVAAGLVSAPNVIVGQSLEVAAQVALTGAPSTATTITLTSSDPNRLRFGVSATDAGAGTIPIPIVTGCRGRRGRCASRPPAACPAAAAPNHLAGLAVTCNLTLPVACAGSAAAHHGGAAPFDIVNTAGVA